MEVAMIAEQMYYIVDTRGNFYRVSDEDQLIVSRDRKTADLFGLKEANKRINNGKKMYFYSILPATSIRDEVPEVHVVEDEPDVPMQIEEIPGVSTVVAPEPALEYDLDRLNWKEYLTHFSYVVSGLKKYQDKLNRDLSEVDMCICDLMHYLELYDLEDVDYIKAAELIKQYREKRRVVKDKFHMTEKFQEAIGTNGNLAKAKSAIAQIDRLDHRIYTPRMLPEIFAGELKPTKKKDYYGKQEADMEQMNDFGQGLDVVQMSWTGQEDEPMMESRERRETIFDGCENDWSGFVSKQAAFFADAKQYVCNLQITLSELDEEIEQVLSDVEEANCNAVQGYKVFKQLKDLRNERKRVARELECVQTITGCFDCEAMRDAYQYCRERIGEIMG